MELMKLFAIVFEIILDLFILIYFLNSRSYTTLSTNICDKMNENGFMKMTADLKPKLNFVDPFIETIKSFSNDPFNFDVYSYLFNFYNIMFAIVLIRWSMIVSNLKANNDGQQKESCGTRIYSRMQNSKFSIIRVQLKKSSKRS
jgi:hypothetical protein